MRVITASARKMANASESADGACILLTIDDPSLSQPIRVVDNGEDIDSRGNTFVAYPFRVKFPDEIEDQQATAELKIDNVDRSLVETIRTIQTRPSVTVELVLFSSPDTVEAGPFDFTLKDVSYNHASITGTLAFEDTLNNPVPYKKFTPYTTPGLFE